LSRSSLCNNFCNCESSRGPYVVQPCPTPFINWENLCSGQWKINLDFPCKGYLMHEVERWKYKIEDHQMNFNKLTQPMAVANLEFFAIISYMLKTIITIPTTSCCCECFFFALRRFTTWLRNSTWQNRLNGLVLLHIHRGLYVNRDIIK